MSQNPSMPESPRVSLSKTADYRDSYANSVHVRLSAWDLQLVFGRFEQTAPDTVQVENFQGIYLSPQQAKALYGLLGHNLAQYEEAFGPITLEAPKPAAAPTPFTVTTRGPIH